MSEHQDTGFKPVAPMPEHNSHQAHNHTVPQPMAAPMPSAMSGLTTDGMTAKPASVLAVVALILGIVSFFISLLALPALIVSILAMKQTADGKQSGRGMAIAGLILSIIDMLLGLLWVGIFAFSMLSARNATNSFNTNYNSNLQSSTLSSSKATLTGSVKTPLVADKYTLTVNSVEHGYKGTRDYYTPAAGNEFILVNLTIKNNDAYSQYFSSYDFAVRDGSGVDHDNKFMLDVPSEFSYKTVEKGAERTGNIVFEVPISTTKQTLVYTPGYFSQDKAEIAL